MVFSVTLCNERGEHSNTDALSLTHFYHSWFTFLLHLHPLPFFVGHRTITRLLHCSKPDYTCYILLLLFLGKDPFSNDSTMSELSLFMVPFSKYVFHSSCRIEKKKRYRDPFRFTISLQRRQQLVAHLQLYFRHALPSLLSRESKRKARWPEQRAKPTRSRVNWAEAMKEHV